MSVCDFLLKLPNRVHDQTWVGKIARLPLRVVPSGMVIPILQGPLRGKRWIIGASTHGCWFGSFEYEKSMKVARILRSGDVFYDVGAHVGYYTLLAATLVSPGGEVIAIEPHPRNLRYLRRHIELNQLQNVTIVPGALCERIGKVFLEESPSSSQHRIRPDNRGTLEVDAHSLDSLVFERKLPPPTVMKIDVEGAEYQVLRGGGEQTLRTFHPFIFLATHGRDVHQKCCDFLETLGYTIESIDEYPVDKTSELVAYFPMSENKRYL